MTRRLPLAILAGSLAMCCSSAQKLGPEVTITSEATYVTVCPTFAREFLRAELSRRDPERENLCTAPGARTIFCLLPPGPTAKAHEECHLAQQQRLGSRFYVEYAVETLEHGYWNNRLERECREVAGQE